MKFTLNHCPVGEAEGTDYLVDTDLITATHLVQLRTELGVTWNGLAGRIGEGSIELPEVVAVVVLSLRQQGLPVDAGWIADTVSMADTVSITVHGDDDDE